MEPRLKSSTKFTPFPKELADQISQIFAEGFKKITENGKFIIEGRIYPEEILLRVGYLESGRLTQNNFESSLDFKSDKENALENIHVCIDAAASMLQEFVESEGEVDFPYQWKEVAFSGKKIFMQYSTVNTDLEEQADKLLGADSTEKLFNDSDSAIPKEMDDETYNYVQGVLEQRKKLH